MQQRQKIISKLELKEIKLNISQKYPVLYNKCASKEILKPIFRSQKYFWSKLPGTRRKEIFYNNFINKAKDIGEEFHKFMVQEKGQEKIADAHI